MKKLIALYLGVLILTGCSFSNSPSNSPSGSEEFCKGLKRNLIFNSTSTPTIGKASIIEREQSQHLYNKYCKKTEK